MAKYVVYFTFGTIVDFDKDIDIIGEDIQTEFTDKEFDRIVSTAFKKLDMSCPIENVDSIERLEEWK